MPPKPVHKRPPSLTTDTTVDDPVPILPQIYLGPRSATRPTAARAHGITHILSLGCQPFPAGCAPVDSSASSTSSTSEQNQPKITYHSLPNINDHPTASLQPTISLAVQIINHALSPSSSSSSSSSPSSHPFCPKILIHCVGGISRSPSILAAYLMLEKGYDLRSALALMVRRRPGVRPNSGFMIQLRELEREITGADNNSLSRREDEQDDEEKELLPLDWAGKRKFLGIRDGHEEKEEEEEGGYGVKNGQ